MLWPSAFTAGSTFLLDKLAQSGNSYPVAQTKAELRCEISQLRKQVKDMQDLMQKAAIKCEELQGAYDATSASNEVALEDLRTFKLPPIPAPPPRPVIPPEPGPGRN